MFGFLALEIYDFTKKLNNFTGEPTAKKKNTLKRSTRLSFDRFQSNLGHINYQSNSSVDSSPTSYIPVNCTNLRVTPCAFNVRWSVRKAFTVLLSILDTAIMSTMSTLISPGWPLSTTTGLDL